METTIRTLRRTAVKQLHDEELDRARITIAAIVGIVSTERGELPGALRFLTEIQDADVERLRMILRVSADKAQRIENQRRNDEINAARPRFGRMPLR